ncbi:prolyl 4-hydroxylase subunit alpha-2-like [Macrobrachium rosenbergii]|uniref:prolyl 4-hydroxylase subunit alpha-2-like n=1 Tax=Macrobrachium rosenbergii TaxID=79674 RepID=UPI0034D3F097
MKPYVSWVCSACLLLPLMAQAEVYTSIQELTAVFSLERRVVAALTNYLGDMETRLARIRKYLQEYEQVSAEGVATDEGIMERLAGNPVHAFHLMKRLTVDWRHIEDQAKKDYWINVVEAMSGGVGGRGGLSVRLPAEEDLHGAAQALVRLHDVYNLNMTQLVRGNVWGVQSYAELTAQDCLYMGKHSFNMGMYPRAIQWFEEAYTLAGLEGNATVTQDQVNMFLNTAIKAYDESTLTRPELGHSVPMSLQKENETKVVKYRLGNDLTPQEDAQNFQALCRGEKLLSNRYLASLTCFYDHRGHPYFFLMPIKVERHYLQPELVTFHDVISDFEINHIKGIAKPMLARAMVQGHQGKGNTVSSTRTSKVGWLDDSFDLIIQRVNKRVEMITGLSTNVAAEDAEMMQVSNYGIGGHYNPHHDYLLVDKTEDELRFNIHPRELVMGDRIATFMFYLSDVTRGGATAFPRLGTAVWPSKGSAAFWHNLKRSGEGDVSTLHGACPVVHGSKWVSNKWIRERGQFLRRGCSLRPED